ncbi:MAG: serine hydrolase domain-containing protein, partial [Bacteroidota bacterium]
MKKTLPFLLMMAFVVSAAYYYAQVPFDEKAPTANAQAQNDAPTNQAAPHVQATVRHFDQYMARTIQNGGGPGAAITFVKDGNILLAKGYGLRDADLQLPVDAQTVFRLASLSKGFAGVLAGQLVEQGTVSWEDRIFPYLPKGALPDDGRTKEITLAHILSNSSGFPHHTYSNLLNAGVPFREIIPLLNEVNLHAPPGEYYAYQNVIFNLATPLLEKKSRSSYRALMRQHLFAPLGMHRASVGYWPMESMVNVARPHARSETAWHPRDTRENFYEVPAAAGVNASISDLSQWLLALLGHQPEALSNSVLQSATAPFIATTKGRYRSWPQLEKAHYAMGWRPFDYAGQKIVYHGGFVRGYRAELFFWPEEDFGEEGHTK